MLDELDEWIADLFDDLGAALDHMIMADDLPDLDDIDDITPSVGKFLSDDLVASSPVLASTDELLRDSADLLEELSGSDAVPTSAESTQHLADELLDADPAQLRVMEGHLEGMANDADVMSSIHDVNQDILDRNAASAAAEMANDIQLLADELNDDAAELIDDTNDGLDTNL